MADSPVHDIIVIGASAGGIEALGNLLGGVPPDLPAAVFIVLHLSPSYESQLDRILARKSALGVQFAGDRERFRPGMVYLAPPDRHLLVGKARTVLGLGPRENHARPAVDPLFRSAAANHTSRTIGVLLSGYLDDGTAGLAAIQRCGGLSVVQDPEDAVHPEMPRSALEALSVDYCVPVAEMGPLLGRLARLPSHDSVRVPEELVLEVRIAEGDVTVMEKSGPVGGPAPFVCPDCGGSLFSVPDGETERYRCRVGHAHGAGSLLHSKTDAVERALWTALRALQERSDLLRHLMRRARHADRSREAVYYEERLARVDRQTEQIRQMLLEAG